MSEMRRRTIGKSPEMPCDHRPDCAPQPLRIVSEEGRMAGAAKITCPASR